MRVSIKTKIFCSVCTRVLNIWLGLLYSNSKTTEQIPLVFLCALLEKMQSRQGPFVNVCFKC